MTDPKVTTPEMESAIDKAIGLKLISIRLPVSLIEDYHLLAKIKKQPYQAIMRNALVAHADKAKSDVLKETVQRKEWGALGGKPKHKPPEVP